MLCWMLFCIVPLRLNKLEQQYFQFANSRDRYFLQHQIKQISIHKAQFTKEILELHKVSYKKRLDLGLFGSLLLGHKGKWNLFTVQRRKAIYRRCSVKRSQPATLPRKRLWCFSVNFAKILRTLFLIEHLRWLLLKRNPYSITLKQYENWTETETLYIYFECSSFLLIKQHGIKIFDILKAVIYSEANLTWLHRNFYWTYLMIRWLL